MKKLVFLLLLLSGCNEALKPDQCFVNNIDSDTYAKISDIEQFSNSYVVDYSYASPYDIGSHSRELGDFTIIYPRLVNCSLYENRYAKTAHRIEMDKLDTRLNQLEDDNKYNKLRLSALEERRKSKK